MFRALFSVRPPALRPIRPSAHYPARPQARYLTRTLAPALLAPCLHATHVVADSAPPLEEVVVTANYRDSRLGDVPASISVITADAMRDRAALHLQDVLNTAPNVNWSAGASRSRFIQIRGIGDLEQFYDPKYYPSVGMMLDQLELGDTASAGMLFDIAQVEVLRGPQGTRYGASGHAGMIKMRSNAPTREFEGTVSGGIGNFDSYRLGLVLSGPLSADASGRLALQQHESDGQMKNRRLGRKDTAGFDELTLRGRLQWTPTDTAQYQLGLLYFDADNGYDAWSLDNSRNTYTDQPGEDDQRSLALSASADWSLGASHQLQLSLSHNDTDLRQNFDSDWVSDELCQQFVCSGGNDTSREEFERERKRSVLDLRLLGGSESMDAGEGRYVLGLYGNRGSEQFAYRAPSLWYGDSATDSDYDTERYAAYGEYEFGLSAHSTLLAGVRAEYFEDDYRDSNGFVADTSAWLWNAELSLRYHINPDSMLYATVASSTKPGGVNTTAVANEPFMSPLFQSYMDGKLGFDEETLLNKEIGLKSELLDGRLALNLALFHTDRKDAQLENWMWDGDAGLWIGYLDSSSDATSYGLELEGRFAATERVELFANIGWLRTEIDEIDTFDLDQNAFVSRENRDQAKSPAYQFNLGTRVALSDTLGLRVEMEGRDDSYFGYYHNGRLDAYELYNASLNWHRNGLSVTLWGRNLGDEEYAVHGLYFGVDPRDNFGAWENRVYTQLGEPRSYGIEVSYDFR